MADPSPATPPTASTSRLELALPVSDRVEIENIILVESHAKRGEDQELSDLRVNHRIQEVTFDTAEADRRVSVLVTIFMVAVKGEITPDTKPDNTPLWIMCKFALNYRIASFDGLTADNLGAFATTNAVFNAWPYWREFVHNTTLRMGMPPLLAPMFRIHDVPTKPPKDSASEEQAADSAGG